MFIPNNTYLMKSIYEMANLNCAEDNESFFKKVVIVLIPNPKVKFPRAGPAST